jgi:hypothetical protein
MGEMRRSGDCDLRQAPPGESVPAVIVDYDLARQYARAGSRIIGGRAPPSLLGAGRIQVELTGFVSDLRPHLAAASLVVVPLRLGGGTCLKIGATAPFAKSGAVLLELFPSRMRTVVGTNSRRM